jgi:glycogen debranching enzyme
VTGRVDRSDNVASAHVAQPRDDRHVAQESIDSAGWTRLTTIFTFACVQATLADRIIEVSSPDAMRMLPIATLRVFRPWTRDTDH